MSKGITPVVATVLLMLISIAAISSASVFIQDTITEVQGSLEDELNRQEAIENSDITINSAYNGTNGYIIADVQNTGSRTLDVERDNIELWNLYVGGEPISWVYLDSALDVDVSINPNDIISFNTTVKYPNIGSSKQISFNAPYESSDSYICSNDNSNFC